MGVVRSEVDFVPVGPLPLPIGVIIAFVVSVTDVNADALLPDAIRLIETRKCLAVRDKELTATEGVLLHIRCIGRFLSLDLSFRPLSGWVQDFVTSTGVNRISGELNIRRCGPLYRVKSMLNLFNLVLRDDSGH
jgi:hypothetical protein